MRIAFITYEYPPDTGKGGIGTYTSQVAQMLVSKGWDVHIFSGTHQAGSYCIESGIHLHKVKCINPQNFTLNVAAVFIAAHNVKNFDVVETPEIHGNAAEIMKLLPQLPLVIRLHAPGFLVEHLKKRYVPFVNKLRFVLGALRRFKWDAGYWRKYNFKTDTDYLQIKTAHKIVAPSRQMKQWVLENWHLKSNQIEIVPNIFSPAPALLQIPTDEHSENKTILFFGRLNVLKGLVNATYALKKILLKHPGWKFLVVGDDGPGLDGKSSLRQWMKSQLQNFETQIQFEDGVAYELLPQYLQKADIVILPSLFESFSYACLEAMAAGKAVVGSKGTGMEGIIAHEQNGLLANPNDAEDIAACIEMLIGNVSKRNSIAREARKTASEKFLSEKLFARYEQLYKAAVAGG